MNRQFAALRGIAMLVVVVHHAIDLAALSAATAGYPEVAGAAKWLLSFFYELGIFAVPLFLFISGAFISYAARGNPPELKWKIVVNGLKRMIGPYILWSLIFYVLVYFHYERPFTPFTVIKSLLTGYPFNFIPLLILYYILSPILVKIARRHGLLLIVGIGLYQLLLINLDAPGILWFRFPEWMGIFYPKVVGKTMALYAVYFPLGLVYSMHAKRVNPILERWKVVLVTAVILLFGVHMASSLGYIRLPQIAFANVFLFLLITPLIKRNKIPRVKTAEKIGKRSYGLYLMHLIVIDLTLVLIETLIPGFLGWQLILVPLLFALGVGVPMLTMEKLAKVKKLRPIYPYIFG